MLKFKKGSYAVYLLQMIALCGEFPWQSLYLLDGNDRIIKRTLKQLKNEEYITVTGKAYSKTIRITKKAFPVLEKIGEGYLEHYLSVTDNHHFRGGSTETGKRQIWRRHRIAEIYCCLKQTECKLWPFEKPTLSLRYGDKNGKNISQSDIIYYTSKEMKNSDVEQRYKTEFTRIMGALISPGGVYCMYNTNKGLIKWNSQGEGKAQVLVEDVVNINCVRQDSIKIDSAIMFGRDMTIAQKILESNGGRRDDNDFEMLSFDNTYDNIYFLTLDYNGINQLKLMLQNNWKEILKYLIFPEHFLDFQYTSIDCDAYDKENKKYIMLFLDGNIGKLKRFKEASYDNKNKKFEVVCFDWQEEMLKTYLPPHVTIKSITFDYFLELLNEENEQSEDDY